MTQPSEKKAGTTLSEGWAERLRRLKNAALFSAVLGFILQIVGTLIGHAQLAQIGMGMFMFGVPVALIGIYFTRGAKKTPPAPVVQKGPARRPPRRKKK